MSYISVCKNVIASNNKRKWSNPEPPIRVAKRPTSGASERGFTVAIKDAKGNAVAHIYTTTNGEPVLKCGAKVAIVTKYQAEVIG